MLFGAKKRPQQTAPAPMRTPNAEVISYIADLRRAGAMMTVRQRDAASELVAMLGLESHHDPQKNWDTFKCLAHVLAATEPGARVLDAGSGSWAVVLRWLHALGYRDLHACDQTGLKKDILSPLGIAFTQQDLTATNYADASFDAITSISVIEHNVPLERFLAEMRRILKPSGLLALSTDYWSDPVDCAGIYPYGEAAGQMKIFDARGIRDFATLAERSGFALSAPLELETRERAVRWERVDREYTFFFMALRKA